MKKFIQLSIPLIILLIVCSLSGCDSFPDDVKEKAEKIAANFDEQKLEVLDGWSYIYSQTNELHNIWSRPQKDNKQVEFYNCSYSSSHDTAIFSTLRPQALNEEYPMSLSFDTVKYYKFRFVQVKQQVSVIGSESQGDVTLLDNAAVDSVFKGGNPFDKLATLQATIQGMDCPVILSLEPGLVEFCISPEYWVYYVGDIDKVSSTYKPMAESKMKHGKKIKEHWYLHKLVPNTEAEKK